jgi:hypothetical protein
MITGLQQIAFLDTAMVGARWTMKYKEQAEAGVLKLRDFGEDGKLADLPVLEEWRSAKALLARYRATAAPLFNGTAPELGKVWIEYLPPFSATPWIAESGDYAQAFLRTRTCLIPSPIAFTHAGQTYANLPTGLVTAYDMRLLCSEVNHAEHPRTHLVVDVQIPPPDADTQLN